MIDKEYSIPGRLRAITDEDQQNILRWRNAPAVRKNMYTQHEISEQEHHAWWSRAKTRSDMSLHLYEDEAGSARGVVIFNAIDQGSQRADWAFYASPDAPRGTGSRMESLALEMAFGPLNLRKLQCEVLCYNRPVIKLHRRFGFKVEGLFRQHVVINDAHHDVVRLAIFPEVWAEKRLEIISRITQKSENTTP